MANSSGMVVRGSMRISKQAGSFGSKKVKAGERQVQNKSETVPGGEAVIRSEGRSDFCQHSRSEAGSISPTHEDDRLHKLSNIEVRSCSTNSLMKKRLLLLSEPLNQIDSKGREESKQSQGEVPSEPTSLSNIFAWMFLLCKTVKEMTFVETLFSENGFYEWKDLEDEQQLMGGAA